MSDIEFIAKMYTTYSETLNWLVTSPLGPQFSKNHETVKTLLQLQEDLREKYGTELSQELHKL